LQPIVGFIEN